MKYFMDAEFNEDGTTIELISIGIVSETGRQLYLVSNEFDTGRCDEWLQTNVIRQLPAAGDPCITSKADIGARIMDYFKEDPDPKMWSFFGHYDWVVFCQIWGKMIDRPKGIPRFCYDLKQLTHQKGNPRLPAHRGREHIAIDDAIWHQEIYDFLLPLPIIQVQ